MGDSFENSQIIFDPNRKEGQLKRLSLNSKDENGKLEWVVKTKDEHWLFERNYEIHLIVDFIFAKESQFLGV